MTKILILNDDRQFTISLERILLSEGYEAVSQNDSSKALDTARTFNPGLFLLDLMMPDPDGFKLCQMLRADSQFTDTPILILSAMDLDRDRAAAFLVGANDYLAIPFRIDELESRIRALMF